MRFCHNELSLTLDGHRLLAVWLYNYVIGVSTLIFLVSGSLSYADSLSILFLP
jgi:hypothetical protein